jgi:hypothetical protein
MVVIRKKTMLLAPELLAEARAACGAATDTDAIRQGLQALIQRAASQRLARAVRRGVERGPVVDVPRRRSRARRRHA